MTKADKLRISGALRDYTAKITKSADAAKAALEREGIFDKDGKISKNYQAPAAA